jgi:hypothetical protein
MAEYTLNINLSDAKGGDTQADRLSKDEEEIAALNEAKARFEAYIGNQEAAEAADKAAKEASSAAKAKEKEERDKMRSKKTVEHLAAATVITGLTASARFMSWRESAIYQDQAAANAIDNAMTVPVAGLAVAGTAKAATAAAASAGPVGAILVAALAVIGATFKVVSNVESWEFQRDKNIQNEIRSSDRLGIVVANRNRGNY